MCMCINEILKIRLDFSHYNLKIHRSHVNVLSYLAELMLKF